MDASAVIQASLAASKEAKDAFAAQSADKLIELAELIAKTFRSGGKLLIFGNGGSAADAQHIAAEFVNRFLINRAPPEHSVAGRGPALQPASQCAVQVNAPHSGGASLDRTSALRTGGNHALWREQAGLRKARSCAPALQLSGRADALLNL
jgi:hypothetical protein